VRYDTEFLPSSQMRYASGVLRAAAGNHEAAIEELSHCPHLPGVSAPRERREVEHRHGKAEALLLGGRLDRALAERGGALLDPDAVDMGEASDQASQDDAASASSFSSSPS
jgi:hypothetical protein